MEGLNGYGAQWVVKTGGKYETDEFVHMEDVFCFQKLMAYGFCSVASSIPSVTIAVKGMYMPCFTIHPIKFA